MNNNSNDNSHLWCITIDYLPIKCQSHHAKLELKSTNQLVLISNRYLDSPTPIKKLAHYLSNSEYYINTHHDSIIRKRSSLHFK
jgi:hypothetical protein